VHVYLDDLEKLNNRLNHYFKMLKKQFYLNHNLTQRLEFKDIEIQIVEHVKDQIHEKCVKYQDLVNGIGQIAFEMLQTNKIITPQQ
jgi:hypothetical protein